MQTQIQFNVPFNTVSEVEIHYKSKIKASERMKVACSRQAYEAFMLVYNHDKIGHKEFFYAMYLNNSNKILGVALISEGGIAATVADMRIIMQGALMLNATSLMVSHNHPSGNLQPSAADLSLTKKLKGSCQALDINLHDHIIVTPEDGYFSFADDGIL